MLKDKIIPALIGELEAKGIKNNPKAKWKLVFSYIPKRGRRWLYKG